MHATTSANSLMASRCSALVLVTLVAVLAANVDDVEDTWEEDAPETSVSLVVMTPSYI